jgi:16S rRNA (guanine527-N7)-methyltransferase
MQFYLQQLIYFGSKHRIISRKDIDHIIDKHFLSSFYFVKKIIPVLEPGDNLLDLGSGAGFPGILLSIFFSEHKVVLVDSIRKKTLFLKRISKKLNLNCDIIDKRIEEYQLECKTSFKIVTARALASINDLVQLASPFLEKAELHTIKGKNYNEEIVNFNQIKEIQAEEFSQAWPEYSSYLNDKVYVTIKI